MKIYNIEMPPDFNFPDLDSDTRAAIDALHAAMLRDKAEADALVERRRAEGYVIPTHEETIARMRCDNRPLRPPALNVAALRELPPRMQAIFAYLYRHDITY
ncbi:UNVERIFIED_ORG: hypothetical protein JN05_03788 [Zoogloea ramigera]|uniref:Uncharacterized protein n=1 Tax=Duganella zoogloeoides TaxID=75659 RepID=A0ABZ0XWU0_9BURK|nr:hypothetical protein [Duganella zoogloeoides]WQH04043.1 hypothetical protein SR858_23815 [Duganella zoogloeoides]